MNWRKLVAILFAGIALIDLALIFTTPMPFTLFYFGFSIYFAYRAKQMWVQSEQK